MPPTSSKNDKEGTIEVSRNPSPTAEREVLENKLRRSKNKSFKQDIRERKRFAENAYGITQAWIGFLMVLTIAQMTLKPIGIGLSEAAFITVFTTTTVSVFGFWLLVGRYLFPGNGKE